MNNSILYLLKFGLIFLGILAIIFAVTLLTPKIAAIIDKTAAKLFKTNSFKPDGNQCKVKSIYDLPEEKSNDTGEMKNGKE